jgi:hypothetical protein
MWYKQLTAKSFTEQMECTPSITAHLLEHTNSRTELQLKNLLTELFHTSTALCSLDHRNGKTLVLEMSRA